MRKIILLLLTLYLAQPAFTQSYLPYYQLVNRAELLTFKGQYKKADKLYQQAFKMVETPQGWNLREAARNAAKMKDTSLAQHYYQQAATLGFDLDDLLQKEDSLALGRRITEIKPHKYSSPLCATVDSLCRQDQLYRKKDYDSNRNKQAAIDSTNIVRILEIRKVLGKIPGIKELGYSRTDHFTTIFCHTQASQLFDSLANILLKQVIQGDFKPNMITRAIDKIALGDADRPYAFTRIIFGSTKSYSRKDSLYYIHPVRNYPCLNKLRQSIGLPTLEQQLLLSEDKTVYDEELVRRSYPKMFMETPPRRPFVDCEGKWMELSPSRSR
ncbi:tetratricopeptide repeat protein [uncultured Acetobacteroides sp.]|uniref:tetratricopeptide repeat protein n=1 Tax=uncultured Acetobacteroides sp. TaxID=1760811 RepID=UPI0029F4DB67|nr:tetratricopeptide repeat protein [uncultured Acetobacteroides sp.]